MKATTDGERDSDKEKIFCYYAAQLGDLREAAVRAGYPPQRAAAVSAELIMQPSIRKSIARMAAEEEIQAERLALKGLCRLALGPVNDAVSLLMREEEGLAGAETLDLFHVSELKRPKGGGLEVKFFSRLDALRLLLEYAGTRQEGNQGDGSFYQALQKAAQAAGAGEHEV